MAQAIKVVGLDLAGKPENDTGYCYLEVDESGKLTTRTELLKNDEQIFANIEATKPQIIAIDAPFSFPNQNDGFFRASDKALQEKGFKPLSPLFRGMQPLVKRAMALVPELQRRGFKVIETFPSAAEKILNTEMKKGVNKDEYDALLCALVAKAYLEGKFEDLKGIVLPKQ